MAAFATGQRRKIIDLCRRGLDTDDVAEVMGAGLAGVRPVWQQYRTDDRDHAAHANCGCKPTLGAAGQVTLLALTRACPDSFCRELADESHASVGVRLSRQTIGRWLATLGLTRKKVAPRQRAGLRGREGGSRDVARAARRRRLR